MEDWLRCQISFVVENPQYIYIYPLQTTLFLKLYGLLEYITGKLAIIQSLK